MTQRIDLHTHVLPPTWEDWAAKFGGERWPRLVPKESCRATIMTGDQFFRDIDDRSWSPARRIEDMDRLGDRPPGAVAPAGDVLLLGRRARQPGLRPDAERERGGDRRAGTPPLHRHGDGPAPGYRLAVKELRHCRERLGLRAVGDRQFPGGRDFDDPALFRSSRRAPSWTWRCSSTGQSRWSARIG